MRYLFGTRPAFCLTVELVKNEIKKNNNSFALPTTGPSAGIPPNSKKHVSGRVRGSSWRGGKSGTWPVTTTPGSPVRVAGPGHLPARWLRTPSRISEGSRPAEGRYTEVFGPGVVHLLTAFVKAKFITSTRPATTKRRETRRGGVAARSTARGHVRQTRVNFHPAQSPSCHFRLYRRNRSHRLDRPTAYSWLARDR